MAAGQDVPQLIQLAAEAVDELRAAVRSATGGLTCSAGIACNPMLAKVVLVVPPPPPRRRVHYIVLRPQIASNFHKPNGQYVLPADRYAIVKFMETLSVRCVATRTRNVPLAHPHVTRRSIPGIGKVGEKELNALGADNAPGVVRCDTCSPNAMCDRHHHVRGAFSPASRACTGGHPTPVGLPCDVKSGNTRRRSNGGG